MVPIPPHATLEEAMNMLITEYKQELPAFLSSQLCERLWELEVTKTAPLLTLPDHPP